MSENTNSKPESKEIGEYRSIFKATSLFGGVQVFKVIIGFINTKVVAMLLGTTGVGIIGLFQSTITFFEGLTGLGLSTSAVRGISEANASGDKHRIGHTVSVFRRLVWITGLFGLCLVLFLSPILSNFTFGNYDYTIPFIFLSLILLIDQLGKGQSVLLQGMRRIKDLAKTTAIGATVGLIISIPIYYFFRLNGIVPTLILNSICILTISWLFARKIEVKKVSVSIKESLHDGKMMLKLGIAMAASNTIGDGFAYILRWFIRMEGGVDEVGLFVAGFTVLNASAGLVFNAMATDYFPRLSEVNQNNVRCRDIVNHQADIALLIIAPILIALVTFLPIVIRVLYTSDFLLAGNYIAFAALGILFRATSWCISYVFIAKGEAKLFVLIETFANVYMLGFNILGYHVAGITGLGIAYFLGYLLYAIQCLLIAYKKYCIRFEWSFVKLLIIQLCLLSVCIACYELFDSRIFYGIGFLLLVFSSMISLKGLDRRLGLMSFIDNYRKKR